MTREAPAASSTRLQAFLRERGVDVVLVVLAFLLVMFTLSYPLGADQGGFHYVGRQWFYEGRLPYRDAVEHKPPGVYIYYGIVIRLLGDNMVGIRVVDIFLTFLLGWMAARLMSDGKVARGLYGATIFFVSIAHYGLFLFWDTAQCDFVAMLLLFASVYHLRRGPTVAWRVAVAGLLVGLSILMKPFALALLLPGGLVLHRLYTARKTPKLVLRDLGLFAGGGLLPIALVALYFVHRGAMGDLVEWVFRVNKYYWKHERGVNDLEDLLHGCENVFSLFGTFGGALFGAAIIGTAVASRDEDKERVRKYALSWALLAAGLTAVAIQLKFFRYHYASLLPGATCLAALVFQEAQNRLGWGSTFGRRAVIAVLALYFTNEQAIGLWYAHYGRTISYWLGYTSPRDYYRRFDITSMGYSYADSYDVGEYIKAHSRPDEEILVRGFCTQTYFAAHRYYSGRFYWSSFLTDPNRMMRPEEWRREDEEHWKSVKPRFIVTIHPTAPVNGSEEYIRFGYVEREHYGLYTVLEYVPKNGP